MPIELNGAGEEVVGPIREALKSAQKARTVLFPTSESPPASSEIPPLEGAAGKLLGVNATEDGLEFKDPAEAGAGSFTDLDDAPSAYTGQAGKMVVVNEEEDGVEFSDPPPDVTGEFVDLENPQTVSGVKTFASSPRSTGEPDDDTSLLTRKQAGLLKFPHLNPAGSWFIRERMEYFANGGTESGNIGELGFSSSGAISYGGAYAFPTGRTVVLITGSTTDDSIGIFKPFATQIERLTALSCYFVTDFPSSATSAINDCAVWVGWGNGHLSGAAGWLLVGWDTAISPNFLIRKKGDLDAVETVVDTGVPVPTNATYWYPHFAIDIIGNQINNDYLGGGDLVRVIITANTSGMGMSVLYDGTTAPSQPIYTTGPIAEVITRGAQAKRIQMIGFEFRHASGFFLAQH